MLLQGFFASLLKWASFERSEKFDEQSEKIKRILPAVLQEPPQQLHSHATYQMLMVELYW